MNSANFNFFTKSRHFKVKPYKLSKQDKTISFKRMFAEAKPVWRNIKGFSLMAFFQTHIEKLKDKVESKMSDKKY